MLIIQELTTDMKTIITAIAGRMSILETEKIADIRDLKNETETENF
jgi:hypothetical protein